MKKSSIITTGLGLFAMFFGAGNVVFPLFVGLEAGDSLLIAMCGLLLTAVALPLLSLFAMVAFRGNQKRYFARATPIGGLFLLVSCLFLLGPMLVIPRTVTVAHASIAQTLFPVSEWLFALVYCLFIFFFAFDAKRMLQIISKVFTPLMLILLGALFIAGVFKAPDPMPQAIQQPAFLFGLKEGYFTLDAIAALIFGQFVYVQLRQQQQHLTHREYKQHVLFAAVLAALLLSAVYLAMAFSAWQHGSANMLQANQKQALLILVTQNILPASWTGLAGLIITMACLTTATALSKIFADYLHHMFRHFKWPFSERHCLLLTLIITFGMSLIGFEPLMNAFAPFIVAVYPVFILLAVHAFARRYLNDKYIPVLALACLLLGIGSQL